MIDSRVYWIVGALLFLMIIADIAAADYGGGNDPSVLLSSNDGSGELYVWQYGGGTRTAARLNDWPATPGQQLCLDWTASGVTATKSQGTVLWLPLVVTQW